MARLSNTALVVLGMLSGGPKSGYDIKQLVDRSTRFFWSASYGQLYPELRRLEEAGLVRGRERARGARSRTAYELTPAGEQALHEWLGSTRELRHEIRDEGVLKLFFLDALAPAERVATIAAIRERYEGLASFLREEVEPVAAEKAGEFQALTARFGRELHEWMAAWFRRLEEDVRSGRTGRGPASGGSDRAPERNAR